MRAAVVGLELQRSDQHRQTYIKNTLPGRLDLVNNAIKSRSPSAKVIALDYPRLFNGTDCNALHLLQRRAR